MKICPSFTSVYWGLFDVAQRLEAGQILKCQMFRRIHFGKFVAESKFQQETERMVELIKRRDDNGIREAITNAAVEKKVLERLRLKARAYGTDPSIGVDAEEKINVDAVVAMYEV